MLRISASTWFRSNTVKVLQMILVLTFCVHFVGHALGQQRIPPMREHQLPLPTGKQHSTESPIKNIGESPEPCQTQYDRFEDKTTVTMVVGTIFESSENSRKSNILSRLGSSGQTDSKEELRLALKTVFDGREVKDKETLTIEWYLQSTSRLYKYHNEANINFIIDGERVNGGKAYSLGGFPGPYEVLERLKLRMPIKTFRRIALGKSVEVKLGQNEFSLKDSSFKALRELDACLGLK
jgi:hypothetical protein